MHRTTLALLYLILFGHRLVAVENRLTASGRFGLSAAPGAVEISQAHIFDEPLLPVQEPTLGDNQALVAALELFGQRTVRDDFSSLTEFLLQNPQSPWALALETQLGSEYYRVGRYSKAIASWKRVLESGESKVAEISSFHANRAGSELAMMYARLGRMAELRPLLAQLEGRPMRGQIPRNLRGARDGLWSMEHRPEVSFRCGPLALDRICFATDRTKAGNQLIRDSESTTNGFSARQVAQLSRQLGMNYQVAFRQPGAEIIFPSVAHWKVGHYAALIARDGNLIRADDPTFGNKTWLSDEALDDEASGYFLVRSGPLPNGWREVSDREAARIWGKGTTHQSHQHSTSREDHKTPQTPQTCHGMAQWNVHLLLASQHVEDTPLGYAPPVGPPINVTLTYNSADAQGLASVPYSNVAPDWGLNWLAWITDDPMNPAGDIQFAIDGGGTATFTDFNSTNQVFKDLFYDRGNLVRTGTNSYELRYRDGSKKIFDLPADSIGTARRIFMTAVVDPAGNAATIQFESPGKISSVTDAIGQKTRFFHEFVYTNIVFGQLPSTFVTNVFTNFYALTGAVDPFGRTALFQADAYGANATFRHLTNIVDSIGLSSSFADAAVQNLGWWIYTLTTPYGTTTFQPGFFKGRWRANWMEITHPNGEKERVEYSEIADNGIPSSEPIGIVPKGVPVRNFILFGRNTYHWDRNAYARGYSPADYSGAKVYHWLHGLDDTTASPILESIKPPLEHRVWFNYEGQVNAAFAGSSDRPTKISRTTEDGTTQLYQFEYNSIGNTTKGIDALGRELTLLYDSNNIDLIEVRQTRTGQNELLFSLTYNAQHQPLTMSDAARQTTSFGYNARGQVLAMTNALGHVTTFAYDSNGYLLAIDGPLPSPSDTSRFTYDAVGRLRTASDVDGYTLTFDYDAMDRLTKMTYPDGTYEEITYYLLDPQVLRDRAGRVTRLTYDSLRQLIAVEDPLGRVTRYDWCGCGGLGSMIDPMGRATSWIRDLQGRIKTRVNADGSQVAYDYDTATGWLKSIRDEQNQITVFDYNLDSTLRQKRYFNALVPTANVKFGYDPNYPRISTMEDGTGVTTFTYHPITGASDPNAGNPATIDGPLPNDTIAFSYDELGRVARQTINGTGFADDWDAAGRLQRSTNSLGIFTYEWDGASFRPSAINYPNGQRSTYSYFPNLKDQLLNQITHLKPNTTLLSRFTYDYNAVRQISDWTQERAGANPIAYHFDYDAADQLTNGVGTQNGLTVASYAYGYDSSQNLTNESANGILRTFTYNVLNELTSITNDSHPTRTYEWDAENRLVAFNQGTHRTEFTYDGLDRRTRIIEKESGVTNSVRQYVWCGTELCEERDASGTVVLKRFDALGVQVGASTGPPPGNYFYTADHLSSIHELTDSAGQPRAVYDYTPYGKRTRLSADVDADFGFTGHYFHAASEMNLAPYRAYDPGLNRWINRDPAGESGGPNLFGYALNDPINLFDPTGREPEVTFRYGKRSGLPIPLREPTRAEKVGMNARAAHRSVSGSTGYAELSAKLAPKLLNKFINWLDERYKEPEPQRRCSQNSVAEVEYYDASKNQWQPDWNYGVRRQEWINKMRSQYEGGAANTSTAEQKAALGLRIAQAAGWLRCPQPFPATPK